LHALSHASGPVGQTLQLELADLLKKLFPATATPSQPEAMQTHTRLLEGQTTPLDDDVLAETQRPSRPGSRAARASAAKTWRLRPSVPAWTLGMMLMCAVVLFGYQMQRSRSVRENHAQSAPSARAGAVAQQGSSGVEEYAASS